MTERSSPAGPAPLLALHEVSRSVAGRLIVDRLSLTMAPGEVLAILGPSGSGKTSLLRMIAGLDAPSDGRILLYGQEVSAGGRILVPPERRHLAVAFQDATLFPHLDAVGNAAFGIEAPSAAERQRRAREALAAMGLREVDGRDIGTLSGGEAQRVSLARALAARARLMLLDEPFGNVDRLTRADLLVRMKARLRELEGAIVVTHDPDDALELEARVLVMRDGRLVADGDARSMRDGAAGDWARSLMRGALSQTPSP